jgi:hypothetical protein
MPIPPTNANRSTITNTYSQQLLLKMCCLALAPMFRWPLTFDFTSSFLQFVEFGSWNWSAISKIGEAGQCTMHVSDGLQRVTWRQLYLSFHTAACPRYSTILVVAQQGKNRPLFCSAPEKIVQLGVYREDGNFRQGLAVRHTPPHLATTDFIT